MTTWKVVPISDRQKKDVREDDLLNGGDFRKCDTYRGGGGYDQFPAIAEKRLGKLVRHQFVVQLYGCNLACPYCYVTQDGIWGAWKPFTTEELVQAFVDSGQEIFHLMGGAPAIYLDQWGELIGALPPEAIFHSDFLLTEHRYSSESLIAVAKPRCLYAIDVKGVTGKNYRENTDRDLKVYDFWMNFDALVEHEVPCYVTFTNPDPAELFQFKESLKRRYGPEVLEDSFVIDLIQYNALDITV